MRNDDLYSPRWTPPHCPNHNCHYHNPLHQGWRWTRFGFYRRRTEPHRIRRFRCTRCRVTFSCQTFSVSYWLRRPDVIDGLITKVTSGAANSQIARDLRVAPSTIDRQIQRLGRHAILFHARQMERCPPLHDVAIDGFVTFEHSQDHPFHLHLAVDRQTSFVPYFTDSEVRRSGKMTDRQKRRRAEREARRGRPDPQAVRKDVTELLEVVTDGAEAMTIHSDDHRAYPWAIRRMRCRITHKVTSSKKMRDRHNHLFEINLLDLLVRHCQAEHKRETISFSKRRNCAAYKLAIFLVQRNYLLTRRVRRSRQTPAQMLGVCQRKLTAEEVLARRLFVDLVALPPRWRRYYWQEVATRALNRNRRHQLALAR